MKDGCAGSESVNEGHTGTPIARQIDFDARYGAGLGRTLVLGGGELNLSRGGPESNGGFRLAGEGTGPSKGNSEPSQGPLRNNAGKSAGPYTFRGTYS